MKQGPSWRAHQHITGPSFTVALPHSLLLNYGNFQEKRGGMGGWSVGGAGEAEAPDWPERQEALYRDWLLGLGAQSFVPSSLFADSIISQRAAAEEEEEEVDFCVCGGGR
ncbi:unnamed protein product [Pleuronectes platessa]|uniref:Uncharacterized protein n=1 Tax=Pleuronectes platessa TaxID=8262 RepID=A0A9N7TR22_PLEPL|nr:unnamed protein product [Pleuronectes platessa]